MSKKATVATQPELVKIDEFVTSIVTKAETNSKQTLTKAQAKAAYEAVFETLKDALLDGKKVTVKNFASFQIKERAERQVKSFGKDEIVTVPATKVPASAFSGTFKEQVKEKFKKPAKKGKK